MILYICDQCMTAVRCLEVPGDVRQHDLPRAENDACAGCFGPVQIVPERLLDPAVAASLKIRDLTFEELYYWAATGALPEDRKTTPDDVRLLLVGKKVVSVDIDERASADRAVINCLVLDDGSRIYLGASPMGAIVYRVAKRTSEG